MSGILASVGSRMSRALVSRHVGTRFINLHEYQSKELMQRFNVAIQKFRVAETATEAAKMARDLS
jgi:hypothetical protein